MCTQRTKDLPTIDLKNVTFTVPPPVFSFLPEICVSRQDRRIGEGSGGQEYTALLDNSTGTGMAFINTGGRDSKHSLFTEMSLVLLLKVIYVRLV